ncbi:MAG: adenosylcobalamin-dependent ribonucleoside-diphosphate reductase [Pseudomonadota bacterium]
MSPISLKTVIKRNNSKQNFKKDKLENAIWTAARNVGGKDQELAKKLTETVCEYLAKIYPHNKELTSSDIGSAVEKILVEQGHYKTVKEFILSREHKRQVYIRKHQLGVKDDIGTLDYNALFILKKRYLMRDENGKTIETPKGMLKRVAKFIAKAEKNAALRKKWEKEFFAIMDNWEFLPGTRVLANAGGKNPQMANCFVFEIDDSIESIFKTLYESSLTKKYGGGCGYNFSRLRPKGDRVGKDAGLAAGPVDIMQMFDTPTSIFRQQGRYESGNMAVLNVDHPDILEFIAAKNDDGILPKTNISVGISDAFMEAVKKDTKWDLINPRTREVVNSINAKAIFELIANYAHRTGDPGILFLNRINEDNPVLKLLGPITATNPCGEEPLFPYESCNLGYLNLQSYIRINSKGKAEYDFKRLAEVCQVATRFMDDVIDVSWYPVDMQTETIKNRFRRIGVGICGWADVLVDMGLSYDDSEAFVLAEKIMKTIGDSCHKASMDLGVEKGPFGYVKYSSWANSKTKPRNIATNTIPPSSSNAVIFNTSFGIEPYFALAFHQNVLGGMRIENICYKLVEVLKREGIEVDNLFERIFEAHGSIKDIQEIPAKIKKLFLTAHEIHWRDHIRMQSAWQKHNDGAITKTINMSSRASVIDFERAYFMAWESGCKGITLYRDQSKADQVIEFGKKNEAPVKPKHITRQKKLRAGDKCPECDHILVANEGCIKCMNCSFSLCEL